MDADPVEQRRSPIGALVVFYLLSGGVGLVYEVAFSKYFAFIFGATAYASSAVLVAFMGGLALGAFIAGKIEHALVRPLLAYGVAEILIGAFCMLAPRLFAGVEVLYVRFAENSTSTASLTLVRGAMAMLIVVVPMAGAGATLPLLARFAGSHDPVRSRQILARLYGVNTAGGALGSLLSAYVVIPSVGLAWTMRGAASISLSIGLLAIVLGWSLRMPAELSSRSGDDPHVAPDAAAFRRALAIGAGSGLLVFASEVVFVHILAVVVGTSVYAFGLILFVFLVCLSLGTPLATWLARRYGPNALAIGLVGTALALALSSVLWDKIPAVFVALGPAVRVWRSRELVRIVCSFVSLFVPVVLMGTTFPLGRRAARAESTGADVGRITAANTLGSIVGSLLGGFVLLPHLGSQRSLLFVAVSYAVLSLVAGGARRTLATPARWAPVVGVGLLVLALPRWDLSRLTSGANVYFDAGVVPKGTLEWIDEDIHGGVTTVVLGDDGQRTLFTNGKFQGNDSDEMRQNRGLAHLPAMFTKGRDTALVIGLGTGTTTGTLGAYDFRHIDVAEISPAMVRAAKTTFRGVNHGILDDPRVHVLVEDGRNVLATKKTQYDLITVEVSSIWFAGAANLYNKEFYDIVSKRLAAGGVLQQWLQLHHTNRRVVTTILATVRSVFPHVLVFVNGHQGHIVASHTPLTVSRTHLFELEKNPRLKGTLGGEHLLDHARGIVLDEERLAAMIADSALELDMPEQDFVSTDDNLFLEYATPKGNVPGADDIPNTVGYLASYRTKLLLLAHLTF